MLQELIRMETTSCVERKKKSQVGWALAFVAAAAASAAAEAPSHAAAAVPPYNDGTYFTALTSREEMATRITRVRVWQREGESERKCVRMWERAREEVRVWAREIRYSEAGKVG